MKIKRTDILTFFTVASLLAIAVFCGNIGYISANIYVNKLANNTRFFIYTGLLAAWGITVYRRVIQIKIRNYLSFISCLMMIWLFVKEIKYHFVRNPAAIRYLWYSYYIPMLLIPLLALYISILVGKPNGYRPDKKIYLLCLPVIFFIIAVLTNDFHQLVFAFPKNSQVFSEMSYSYGPLYFLIILWLILCSVSAFAIMFSKAGSGKLLWLPLIPFFLIIIYTVLYIMRIPFVIKHLGDLTVFLNLNFAAFFEICVQCGHIPSNTHYYDLFSASVSLPMQITDENYNIRYSANSAEKISKEEMRSAKEKPLLLPCGKLLHNMPVNGGYVIWTEDISELIALKETLSDRHEELSERNALLRYEYEKEKEFKAVEEKNRLYDLLQIKTQPQINKIDLLLNEYSSEKDLRKKKKILAVIVVIGSYIKRKKDLILSADSCGKLSPDKLKSAFSESYRSLNLLGIRGSYLTDIKENIPEEIMTLAYDFFEYISESLIEDMRYINTSVISVNNKLRIGIYTDCEKICADIHNLYPKAKITWEENDGVFYTLPLEGDDLK